MKWTTLTIVALLAGAIFVEAHGQELSVVDVSPTRNGISAPRDASISIDFDRPVDPTSVTADSITAFGRWSGTVTGSFEFANGNQTVILNPDEDFSAGELVSVVLSHDLAAADASPFRDEGYSYQFWSAAASVPSPQFNHIMTLSAHRPGRACRYLRRTWHGPGQRRVSRHHRCE